MIMTSQAPTRLEGVRACVFDAYGTLFDFASAVTRCEDAPAEQRAALTALWRDKQLQYTWLRSLQNRYADFWQVTEDALAFALESLGLDAPTLRERLMELYLGLEPFPEVPEVLRALRARGFKTAILSNGSQAMLATLVQRAGLAEAFDAVLSADAVRVFKTHRKSISSRSIRSACRRRRSRSIVQRLGRLRRLGLRHARGLVQPRRPAPRTPARRAGRRSARAGGAAGAVRGGMKGRAGRTGEAIKPLPLFPWTTPSPKTGVWYLCSGIAISLCMTAATSTIQILSASRPP